MVIKQEINSLKKMIKKAKEIEKIIMNLDGYASKVSIANETTSGSTTKIDLSDLVCQKEAYLYNLNLTNKKIGIKLRLITSELGEFLKDEYLQVFIMKEIFSTPDEEVMAITGYSRGHIYKMLKLCKVKIDNFNQKL